MNEQQTFTIGAFSKKTGIAVHTLHYYDELGLLQPAKHPTSGHRIYTVADAILQIFRARKPIAFANSID